jgi:hypothetical protein
MSLGTEVKGKSFSNYRIRKIGDEKCFSNCVVRRRGDEESLCLQLGKEALKKVLAITW